MDDLPNIRAHILALRNLCAFLLAREDATHDRPLLRDLHQGFINEISDACEEIGSPELEARVSTVYDQVFARADAYRDLMGPRHTDG